MSEEVSRDMTDETGGMNQGVDSSRRERVTTDEERVLRGG